MTNFIVVDVGASIGEFSQHVLASIENARIYAVEPNIDTNGKYLDELKKEYGDRVSIHPYALAEATEWRHFFGSTQINGQIGSLKKFNPDKIWNSYLEEKLDKNELAAHKLILAKSVADFLIETNLHEIDFLKIDAQGYDVELLEKFLECCTVKCLVLEVNTTANELENIYESNINNLNHLARIISKYNLNIIKIVPHHDFTELNVFLAYDTKLGQDTITNLKLSESPTFERGWSVTIKSNTNPRTKLKLKDILVKIIKIIAHPNRYSKKLFNIMMEI